MRFLLYSHDGLGLGHVRRNLAIGSALLRGAPDASILLVTGSGEVERLGIEPGIDVLKLPALRKLGNGRYAARRLAIPSADLTALRAGQIAAAVSSFRPDVMLVDKHPAGARGELRPALSALARSGGRAVAGFRDILDDPATVRKEWREARVAELIAARFATTLVYGLPQVLDFRAAYGLPRAAAPHLRYTGYVVHDGPCRDAGVESLPAFMLGPRSRPVVLASAGGGEDGGRLLLAFVEAARRSTWRGVIVPGPELPRDVHHALRRAAVEAGVEFHPFAHDLGSWLGEVDATVCMGGYNTLGEALSRGTPTVCVPRVSPRVEQLIRARSFERLGLLRLLEPSRLQPDALAAQVALALESNREELAHRARAALGFAGAGAAAETLLWLAAESRRTASATGVGSLRGEVAMP